MEQKSHRHANIREAVYLAFIICFLTVPWTAAHAQRNGCPIASDGVDPAVKILRCPNGLTIHVAPGTRYRLIGGAGSRQPAAAQLNNGALLIELDSTGGAKSFQILTPHAIAAVRGTQWAMEVNPRQTSALVIAGIVAVAHPGEKTGVAVGPGQGVDVAQDQAPLTVRVWGAARVKALLARFGR
jgi:FecR-like protein